MKKNKRRARRYLTGFEDKFAVLAFGFTGNTIKCLTLAEAKKALGTPEEVVYELVPIRKRK